MCVLASQLTNEREVENKLVVLLDYDKFPFIKVIAGFVRFAGDSPLENDMVPSGIAMVLPCTEARCVSVWSFGP